MEEEIILNLWYVYDDKGIIYSLRIKPYVMIGSDGEKIEFLKERARHDYLVACPFPIPNEFKTQIEGKIYDVALIEIVNTGNAIALFEEAIQQTEKLLPMQTELSIPESPIVVITPLFADNNDKLIPKTSKLL